MRSKLLVATAAGLLLVSSAARAVLITETIDFNLLPDNFLFSGGTSVTLGSFTYGPPPFGARQRTLDNGGGNIVMVDGNPFDQNGAAQTLTRTGGGIFDVLSIDIADLTNNPLGGGGSGGLAGSGSRIGIQGSGVLSFSPISSTFSTIDLSGNSNFQGLGAFFVNIVSAAGIFDNFAIDNIVVQFEVVAVPEPSTLALLGLGLFGMGLARKRTA